VKGNALASFQSKLIDWGLRYGRATSGKIDPKMDPAVFRKRMDKAAIKAAKLPRDAVVTPVDAAGVPCEWLELPESRAHRVILYLHGGGYVFGSSATHRAMVARICRESAARALIVNYRLAPEYPYPAALEDSLTAYAWLMKQGIDPRGVVIAGDSAGGGLTLASLMALRDLKRELPAAGVLLSPWLDMTLSGWSMLTNEKTESMLSMQMLSFCARHYLNGHNPADAKASPLFGDFHGLPSLLIHVGSHELLRDDAVRAARQAEAAGVDVSVEVFDGMMHVFHFFPGLPEGRAGVSRVASFVKSRTVTGALSKETAAA